MQDVAYLSSCRHFFVFWDRNSWVVIESTFHNRLKYGNFRDGNSKKQNEYILKTAKTGSIDFDKKKSPPYERIV